MSRRTADTSVVRARRTVTSAAGPRDAPQHRVSGPPERLPRDVPHRVRDGPGEASREDRPRRTTGLTGFTGSGTWHTGDAILGRVRTHIARRTTRRRRGARRLFRRHHPEEVHEGGGQVVAGGPGFMHQRGGVGGPGGDRRISIGRPSCRAAASPSGEGCPLRSSPSCTRSTVPVAGVPGLLAR